MMELLGAAENLLRVLAENNGYTEEAEYLQKITFDGLAEPFIAIRLLREAITVHRAAQCMEQVREAFAKQGGR